MLQVNPHPGWFLAAALADLVENNIHLTSLGLEWNSIGMVESGMQRLCHVRHCKASTCTCRGMGARTTVSDARGGDGTDPRLDFRRSRGIRL